ncbi:histidine kinase [Methylobacterium oxalidis]
MWLEDVLAGAGFTISGPYGTWGDAAASLEVAQPDFAVISIDLNEGPGFPLACVLRRRGIPFALISGSDRVPRAFADVPLFDRLFDADDLVKMTSTFCASQGCRGRARACPMLRFIEAGEVFALDQCPTACRA